MMCAIGIVFIEKWSESAVGYLKTLQKLTETARDNLVVVISRDLRGFKYISGLYLTERKFLFVHEIDGDISALHPFCPKCVGNKDSPEVKMMWKRGRGIVGVRRNDRIFDPFIECCNVFKGRMFKVGYNGDPPHMMGIPKDRYDQSLEGFDFMIIREAFRHLGKQTIIRLEVGIFNCFKMCLENTADAA